MSRQEPRSVLGWTYLEQLSSVLAIISEKSEIFGETAYGITRPF